MQAGLSLYQTTLVAMAVAVVLWNSPSRAAEVTAAPGDGSAVAADQSGMVDGFLTADPLARPRTRGRCLLVPAFTDRESGTVAGKAFAQLTTDLDRVILLATRSQERPAIVLPAWESMRTVLGNVPVDTEALRSAAARPGVVTAREEGHADQAMASVLPFLQRRLKKPFQVVPIEAAATADPSVLAELVRPWLSQERTALVVVTTGAFTAADLQALFATAGGVAAGATRALPAALLAAHAVAGDLGWEPVVTGLATSADGLALLSAVLVEDVNRVDLLAQASKVTWDDPLTQSAFQDATRASGRSNFQGDLLSQPEQAVLLRLARTTIAAKLKGGESPAPPLYSDTLSRLSGCFVTLNKAGELRGCLGTILPKEPLATTVQRYALAAAFEDKRFSPLTAEELPAVDIEISVLTPLQKIDFRDGQDLLDKLTPGVHGVLLTYEGSKRTTFLPAVWKQFPDKQAFLKALCRKGAIPTDAWQDPAKTTVEVYESFDFREPPRGR